MACKWDHKHLYLQWFCLCLTAALGAINHPIKAQEGPEALLQIQIKFAFIHLFSQRLQRQNLDGKRGTWCILYFVGWVVLPRELTGVALAPSINRLEKATAVILVWLLLINSTAGELKKKKKKNIKKAKLLKCCQVYEDRISAWSPHVRAANVVREVVWCGLSFSCPPEQLSPLSLIPCCSLVL